VFDGFLVVSQLLHLDVSQLLYPASSRSDHCVPLPYADKAVPDVCRPVTTKIAAIEARVTFTAINLPFGDGLYMFNTTYLWHLMAI